MAFLRKIPENPIIMEHFKGGAGHIENYPIRTRCTVRAAYARS